MSPYTPAEPVWSEAGDHVRVESRTIALGLGNSIDRPGSPGRRRGQEGQTTTPVGVRKPFLIPRVWTLSRSKKDEGGDGHHREGKREENVSSFLVDGRVIRTSGNGRAIGEAQRS